MEQYEHVEQQEDDLHSPTTAASNPTTPSPSPSPSPSPPPQSLDTDAPTIPAAATTTQRLEAPTAPPPIELDASQSPIGEVTLHAADSIHPSPWPDDSPPPPVDSPFELRDHHDSDAASQAEQHYHHHQHHQADSSHDTAPSSIDHIARHFSHPPADFTSTTTSTTTTTTNSINPQGDTEDMPRVSCEVSSFTTPEGDQIVTLAFNNGDRYEGLVKDSVPNGKGKMMYKNGSVYQGEWVDGQRHGLGICCFESGSKYEGEWKDGMYSGFGRYTFADGTVYTGQFLMGEKVGRGKLRFTSGNEYDTYTEPPVEGRSILSRIATFFNCYQVI